MSGEEITKEELIRLFEAARWAPSPFNVQEWRALYVRRGTKHWPVFFELLMDGSPRPAADLLGVATSSTGAIPQLRSYRSANLVRLPLTGYVFGGSIPGFVICTGAVLTISDRSARHRNIAKIWRVASMPALVGVCELLVALLVHPFWEDKAKLESDLLRATLKLTEPGDFVFDRKRRNRFPAALLLSHY